MCLTYLTKELAPAEGEGWKVFEIEGVYYRSPIASTRSFQAKTWIDDDAIYMIQEPT